jgi:hypothetical protein
LESLLTLKFCIVSTAWNSQTTFHWV